MMMMIMIFRNLLLFLLLLINLTYQENKVNENSVDENLVNIESGVITTLKELSSNSSFNKIYYYSNELKLFEGVYLNNNLSSNNNQYSNEIKIYLEKIPEKAYLYIISNDNNSNSKKRVRLITLLSNYFNISSSNLKINSISRPSNDSLIVSLSNKDEELMENNKCLDFIENVQNILKNNTNNTIKFNDFRFLNQRISKIELNNKCEKNEIIESFNFLTMIDNLDDDLYNDNEQISERDDFLIAVLIPSVIMGTMLILAILLAYILNHLNKKDKKRNELRDKNPIFKQKSYLSKGVPVILYEEMNEKPVDDDDLLNGGHRMPLIMRNEKPASQPAPPPEYKKQLSLQQLNDEQTINDIKNMLNNAPLASTEHVNDDTIPFLNSNNNNNNDNNSLFYQPPQPIAGIKDVSRRPHTSANQNQEAQLLP